jgi:hypothetical protein
VADPDQEGEPGAPLDDVADPRVRLKPHQHKGRTVIP